MEVNNINDGLRWNSWEWVFIILKNISIRMQNLAVPDASGSPYWYNILEKLQLKTCATNLTFIVEYGVTFVWSFVNLSRQYTVQ